MDLNVNSILKITKIDSLISGVLPRREETVGIAFGGGGARGFSHVGVIRAFEQYEVKPRIISGVSAGSIAAVLWGAGLDSTQIKECFAGTKFGQFTDMMLPRKALFKMNKFARMLEEWLPIRNLEDMRIPTVICATDFDHAKSVGWAKGEIVPRVVASCSIPIVFPPVTINGVHYVDGGVLRNLPAWAIRKHCSVLFGSNCSPLNRNYTPRDTLIATAIRSYQMMSKSNTLQDINLCDYMIQPVELGEFSTFDMSKLDRAVEIGYAAASRVLERYLKQTQ
ncbi:MAG: phospholipase [Bacteroides sp.]|nr:phospholipase [Bacteroides sp.]